MTGSLIKSAKMDFMCFYKYQALFRLFSRSADGSEYFCIHSVDKACPTKTVCGSKVSVGYNRGGGSTTRILTN